MLGFAKISYWQLFPNKIDLINLNLNNQAQIRCSNPVEIGNLFFLVVAGL
jgi:hypothetical protein